MQNNKKVIVFDCAIKVASDPCIERLRAHFSDFDWQSLRAMDLNAQEFAQANDSDIIFIFGSHSNVEDRLPWHHELAKYTKERLLQGTPTLGLCFGHQLIADIFGGEISRHSHAPLKGLRKVAYLQGFGNLKSGTTVNLGVSHSYEVSKIPKEFEVLASSPDCRFDALKHRTLPYFGFQSHPEASESFFKEECPQMTASERELVGVDGLKTIEAFLQISLNEIAKSSKRT